MSIERARADLQKAKNEMERLRGQLQAASARVLKLENYIEMAALYEIDLPAAPPGGQETGSPLVPVCMQIIRERGERQPTRRLVEELERRGYVIGGTNKITNLSGALSRARDLLTANRVEGWGLKEWDHFGMGPARPEQTRPSSGSQGSRYSDNEPPDWEPPEPEPPDDEMPEPEPSDLDDEIPF